MGENGYRIILFDDFGAGLVMINPRFYSEGVDIYGNPCNWWPCTNETNVEEVIKRHKIIDGANCEIIFDSPRVGGVGGPG